jgi:hypothetical protein
VDSGQPDWIERPLGMISERLETVLFGININPPTARISTTARISNCVCK